MAQRRNGSQNGSQIPRFRVLSASALLVIALLALAFSGSGLSAAAIQATPTPGAPTLVPPTLVPVQAGEEAVVRAEFSALADIQENRVLRVGTYYNAYPFAWLNQTGVVDGYETDVMRAIGIELGVDIEFVQVTRQNDVESLLSGNVDILIGQQVHTRDREEQLDFCHPYYINEERMVIRQGTPYTTLGQMANLPISVEIGSRGHRALLNYAATSGIQYDIRTYFSESAALDALANGDVEGMVGTLDSLRRAGRQQMSLIDQPILTEPYAIAVRRYDVNLRNLLNRSLQKLKASGRMDEIYDEWFPNADIDFNSLIPVYETLYEDARGLDDFNPDIPYPPSPVLERIQNGLPIRVAGLVIDDEDPPAQARILNDMNRAMVDYMALQWGAQVQYIPNSSRNAVDLVANGQADLAVGVSPRWDGADRVEYSLPYVQHGDRLMVPVNETITGFAGMRGTGWFIGYFADDEPDADHIRYYAEFFGVGQNVRDPFQIYNEDQAIYTMVQEDNINAIYGDSLRLLALMREGDGDSVKLLDDWYGDILPITFAVPRNDADFRALVDFALQDMARDGVYQQYWDTYFGLGDPIPIPYFAEVSPDTVIAPGS
ncbi:MAG: transporter substrate-binding domain-containing protein [Chloroflexi bacterium]|nr:transporter substrate-binding domain-containing protein [Chloroflexota bacterium]